jgi:anaerobic selenocysteine-containing dehydrogenase
MGRVKRATHGIDLGPLQPHLATALRTKGKRVRLAPEVMLEEAAHLDRLAAEREAALAHGYDLILIGRRQLRSNNSWMHNLPVLVKGKSRCTLHVHPEDAARYRLADGALARLRSRTGAVEAEVEITDEVMPGVVSLPHGWGHGVADTRMAVAAEHAGTNSNVLADELLIDAVSGNAVLNGIPVQLSPVG